MASTKKIFQGSEKHLLVKPGQSATQKATQPRANSVSLVQRAGRDAQTLSSQDILQLQKTVGNGALGKMLGPAKVQVRPAGDAFEQEASRTAAAVMSGPQGTPAASPSLKLSTQGVSRQTEPTNPARGFKPSQDFEQSLSLNQGGNRLPETVRAEFEPKFGADFGAVRIHSNSMADALNRKVSAKAFTHGQDIYFRGGQYEPKSNKGKALLAHELTHTIQQKSSTAIQRNSSEEDPAASTASGGGGPVAEVPSRLSPGKTLKPGEGVIGAISKEAGGTGGHAWVSTEYVTSGGEKKNAVMHLTARGGKGDSASGGSGGSGGSVGSDNKSAKQVGSVQSGAVSNAEDSGSLVYSKPSNTNVGSAEPTSFKGSITININEAAEDSYLGSMAKKTNRTWSINQSKGEKAVAHARKMEAQSTKGKYIYSITGRSISLTKTGMNCARFAEEVINAAGLSVNGGWIIKTPRELATGKGMLRTLWGKLTG
jgi:Domain of unknown function (DUF4157)